MTSSLTMFVLGPDPEGDMVDVELSIDYSHNGAYGIDVAHFGEPLDGSSPIKLTPAEIERATDRAYQDQAEERDAAS